MALTSLQSVQGVRSNGTIFYDDESFLYQKNKEENNIYYFVCKIKHCPARLTCRKGERFVLTNKHNHDPEQSKLQELKFKQRLRKRAATETEPLSRIYIEEEQLNREGAIAAGQYGNVKMMMHRARLKNMPPTPKDLVQMDKILQQKRYSRFAVELGPLNRPFYSGLLKVEEKTRTEHILYFTSPTIRQLANDLEELTIQMDGTFAVVPKIGKTKQLFCVHIYYENHIYPLLYALMEYKSQKTYQELLTVLKNEIIPGKIVKKAMADFERTLRNAFRLVFPETHLYGCWFHFANAVNKKSMKEGLGKATLHDDIKFSCRMAMALALLPEYRLEEGINVIHKTMTRVADGNDDLLTKISKFCRYLHKWKGENISLWKISDLRTNSAVEAFHRSLMLLVGRAHPNTWMFVKFIQLFENTNACSIIRAKQGHKIPYRRRQKMIRVNTVIEEQSLRLSKNGDVEQFLRSISFAMKGVLEDCTITASYSEGEDSEKETQFDEEIEGKCLSPKKIKHTSLEEQPDGSLCKHCSVYVASYAYIPCGHRNTCENCVPKLKNLLCPTCNKIGQNIYLIQ